MEIMKLITGYGFEFTPIRKAVIKSGLVSTIYGVTPANELVEIKRSIFRGDMQKLMWEINDRINNDVTAEVYDVDNDRFCTKTCAEVYIVNFRIGMQCWNSRSGTTMYCSTEAISNTPLFHIIMTGVKKPNNNELMKIIKLVVDSGIPVCFENTHKNEIMRINTDGSLSAEMPYHYLPLWARKFIETNA